MSRDISIGLSALTPLIFSVSQINFAIAKLLEQTFTLIKIKGEVANFICASSGHWYFLLKDNTAQIRCVMFKGRNQSLREPKSGQFIEIHGTISLYLSRGEIQINVENLFFTGFGDLFLAFELLKKKLAAEGLFAAEKKRAIPLYPKTVGVITSLQAAALADVLAVFTRRSAHISIYIYPALVQGELAAAQLVAAINLANLRKDIDKLDVLLLCRGGGSIEDLFAFNQEILARSIAASQLPIVVGVGHEIDFTIADFVADLRASTPSAAAELIGPERNLLLNKINLLQEQLQRNLQRSFNTQVQRLDYLTRRLVHPKAALTKRKLDLESREQNLKKAINLYLLKTNNKLKLLINSLASLNPLAILQRGYAVLLDESGVSIKKISQLQQQRYLDVYLAEGHTKLVISQP